MEVLNFDDLERGKKRVKKLRLLVVIAAVLILVVIAAIIAKTVYMEVIQLDEIGGLSGVFWTNIGWKAASFAFGWLAAFIALFITGLFVRRNFTALDKSGGNNEHEPSGKSSGNTGGFGGSSSTTDRNLTATRKNPPIVLPALVISFIGGLLISQEFYIKALTYFNSTPFGTRDPLFLSDVGYYVFQRPFLLAIYSFFSGLTVLVIVSALIYYAVLFYISNRLEPRDILKNHAVITHNLINVALFIAVRIPSYTFARESLLYSDVVGNMGAGYTDVNVMLRYYTAAPFILVAVLLAGLVFLFRRDIKKALISFAVYPAIYIVMILITAVVQNLIVSPNEYSMEKPYLENNIKSTREAFGLDKISYRQFPETKVLTPEIVTRNSDIIENIRVVDIDSTILNNIQLQSNTNFYSFSNGDILNYEINNQETPVFTSVREVDQNRIPDKSYINTKYKYTHGYGIVMNSINKITPKGQVEYVLSGLRMRSEDANIVVEQPRVYYGELTNEQVIVNAAGIDEIDYDGNETYRYTGSGGLKLGMLNRLLFAIENGDLNLLTSNYAKDATLLINRNVAERAQLAFPFLHVDPEAYIVLTDDGRLVWVLNAYTYTDQYPYSQVIRGVNYIRNSVKITIDAYNGDTKYYIIDHEDPIIKTYARIYPGVFLDEPLPISFQKHNRFPETLFSIQADVLRRYHLPESESAAFYSQQDLWAIAKRQVGQQTDETGDIEPYYNLLMLPDGIGTKEELILMLPFTPSGENKNNMVSWLAVRNGYENYGEMILFEFQKNTNVFGPIQVEVKINQIDKISSDMTLWGQSGSDVYKGNLLVIPIEDSVLYVEPVYIRAAGESSIPEVREIVVGYQDGDEFIHGIGTNLQSAFSDLFKGAISDSAASWFEGEIGEASDSPPPTLEPAADATSDDPANSASSSTADGSPGNTIPENRDEAISELNRRYDELRRQIDEIGAIIDVLQ